MSGRVCSIVGLESLYFFIFFWGGGGGGGGGVCEKVLSH